MSRKENITMRLAAVSLGVKRVQEAKKIVGCFRKTRAASEAP